jgi:hypothetical protein
MLEELDCREPYKRVDSAGASAGSDCEEWRTTAPRLQGVHRSRPRTRVLSRQRPKSILTSNGWRSWNIAECNQQRIAPFQQNAAAAATAASVQASHAVLAPSALTLTASAPEIQNMNHFPVIIQRPRSTRLLEHFSTKQRDAGAASLIAPEAAASSRQKCAAIFPAVSPLHSTFPVTFSAGVPVELA